MKLILTNVLFWFKYDKSYVLNKRMESFSKNVIYENLEEFLNVNVLFHK